MSRRAMLIGLMGMTLASVVRAESPNVKVTLHASVEAVAPGEAFEAAVQFEVPDGWHIYWENPGESGLPPHIQWRLPDGFVVEPPQFPMPSKHESSGIVTNILEGKVTLLSRITPPKDLTVGAKVTLAADVSWLVCKEACYPGKAKVQISLPVAQESKPVGDEESFVFRLAKRKLPVAPEKARAVKISPSVSQKTVSKGDAFDIVLDVDIKKGFHAQSNKPLGEFFVPSEVFVSSVEGISAKEAIWPQAHIRNDKTLGKISEFSDRIKVRIPCRVSGPTADETVRVAGLFKYQACTDKGQCYPAEAVPWSVTIRSETVKQASAANEGESVADAGAGADANDDQTDLASNEAGGDAEVGAKSQDPLARKLETLKTEGGLTARLLELGLAGWIILGMLGGLILNIMPCVLPVISIKVMSFIQQADEDPKRVFQLGLIFSAGILVSFWILAIAILTLRSVTGLNQSWGALFQQPVFVISMISVVFVFALSLFGVFEITLSSAASTRLSGAAEREGFGGAFMKGVLATLLATPCTAPLLAPAIALALAAPITTTMTLFTAVGAGMALPYVLLTARPGWMKKVLPKPGNWMVAFKQLMGFLLVGTAVWLLWILGKLMDADAVVWTVAFLGFLSLASWLYGKTSFNWSVGRRFVTYMASIAIAFSGAWFCFGFMYEAPEPVVASKPDAPLNPCDLDWTGGIPWIPYEKGLAQKWAAEGYTVYVDYTAAWCLTCQTNKKVALGNDEVRKRLKDGSIIPIKADFTRYDPDIQADLDRHGRDAVPLNIILPANKPRPEDAIVLPTVLLPGIVLSALEEAGPSTKCAQPIAQAG